MVSFYSMLVLSLSLPLSHSLTRNTRVRHRRASPRPLLRSAVLYLEKPSRGTYRGEENERKGQKCGTGSARNSPSALFTTERSLLHPRARPVPREFGTLPPALRFFPRNMPPPPRQCDYYRTRREMGELRLCRSTLDGDGRNIGCYTKRRSAQKFDKY